MLDKSITRCLPFFLVRDVKHQQVLNRGAWRHRMFAAVGELEVIVHTGTSEHDSVEPLMILKSRQHGQVESSAVHALGTGLYRVLQELPSVELPFRTRLSGRS